MTSAISPTGNGSIVWREIPADQYGFAKYLCSRLAQDIDNVIVLRPFGVWGKYEDYETRFMSNAICKTLYDLPITLNQNAYFDYLFIDDFVKIVEFLCFTTFVTNTITSEAVNELTFLLLPKRLRHLIIRNLRQLSSSKAVSNRSIRRTSIVSGKRLAYFLLHRLIVRFDSYIIGMQ